MPDDTTIVETAAARAEEIVFERLSPSQVNDLDVTVKFDDGNLEIDVFVSAPDASIETSQVVDDAAIAARRAVDDLLEDSTDSSATE